MIEIGVFIQVGDILGLVATLAVVFITAVIGVNLLKQQGLKTCTDIQFKIAQGQIPAIEMASAAQLLFAGGLLLTPGFVTDSIGFTLMVPAIRLIIAKQLLQRWTVKAAHFSQQSPFQSNLHSPSAKLNQNHHSRTIEGEFEDQSK